MTLHGLFQFLVGWFMVSCGVTWFAWQWIHRRIDDMRCACCGDRDCDVCYGALCRDCERCAVCCRCGAVARRNKEGLAARR